MNTPLQILIVEDNESDAELVLAELRRDGFEPVWKRIETEPDFLAEIKESPAIILCDYSMPQFSGLRALELLRESGLKIPFILISGTVGEEIAVEAIKDGATDYLLKDRLTRLGSIVRRALNEVEARAKQKILAEETILQAMALKAAANAIVITNPKGIILSVNPTFTALTGYSEQEAVGKTPRLVKSGKHDPAFYENLWRTILAGETWQGEFTNRRKDGSTYIGESTITPVRAEGGKITHFIGIMNDVTDRKQLEAQFIEAQKMEVVGHLAGGVAHDFNNVLAVIMGYSDLLASELGPDNPLQKFTDEIHQATTRAAGLTRQLLIFSRKQTVEPVVLDLNEVIKDMDKMLRRLVDENVAVEIVPGQKIGHIKADSGYVGQVLMNLVVNARDAMPNGGKLTIATGNVTLDENFTRNHPDILPGDYVRLSVTDTGIGMTEEIKNHIFDAFFTTKPIGKGTGLGLATCQTIVQQCSGHIEVLSEPGKGATFKIYFPRVDQPLDHDTQFIKAGPIPRGTETLLLVEDDPSVRHLACNILEGQGYTVLRANNGQDGLHVAREHKGPTIRLVVTDVIMPVMNGKVMAEWLKTTDPDLKILFTSGYTDDAIAQHGVLEAGVAFLSKPYAPATLARKVREMLDKK